MPYKVGMTRLAKVPMFGNVAKAVTVDLDATAGAQIGVNLLGPDGELVRWDQIANSEAAGGGTGSALTTTDDLEEGQWNLWFTNRRAQDAVRASLERRMISDNKLAASGPGTAADLQAGQGSAIGRGLFGDPLAGKPGALSRSIGIGLGGTLGHMIPVPGAGIAGAMLGGLLPEAAQGVNAKIAQRIGSTALDSKATADAIERALLKQSQKKKSGALGDLLLLGNGP